MRIPVWSSSARIRHIDPMANPKSSRRAFPRTCVCCGSKSVQPSLIDREFDVKHDGRHHHVMVRDLPVEQCASCKEVTLGSDSDEYVDAALREHLGLLPPERIRSNRIRLGMTQVQLAEQIGCASETLSRWENGALVQSRGADRLLRAYFAMPSLRAFFVAVEQDRQLGSFVVTGVHWALGDEHASGAVLPNVEPLPKPARAQSAPLHARGSSRAMRSVPSSPSEYPRLAKYNDATAA